MPSSGEHGTPSAAPLHNEHSRPNKHEQFHQNVEGEKEEENRSTSNSAKNVIQFSQQAQKLSLQSSDSAALTSPSAVATQARFITPHDPVLVTADGNRLPGVPLQEAHKLNILREELEEDRPEIIDIKEEGGETKERITNTSAPDEAEKHHKVIELPKDQKGHDLQKEAGGTLRRTMPPSHTNPLFPPLPLYGPSSILRELQCTIFRIISFFLSLAFLGTIVLGSLFTSIPLVCKSIFYTLTFRDLNKERPFYAEELHRSRVRKEKEKQWGQNSKSSEGDAAEEFPPTEGGKDPIKCDVGYYARRVGLDVEAFRVQTEDGFIIDLWHVYDPKEYTERDPEEREQRGPDLPETPSSKKRFRDTFNQKPKFPVLLMHGLLQSAGAFCCNDDDSLAFWLCKAGYDVWLGNNRCGFEPKHVLLKYNDPRMWCWNIRQMGVFDLPALVSRVLVETGFPKLGLICHSQGTTQTFVALAKEQRPDIGEKITVFCALAPAAYAGPLIGKMYFKFMRIISPSAFRLMFGIHAFIPFMMQMHALLNPHLYGWLGYKVFSFLFDWTDTRWDRGLKDRMFQFSPVYVSAESMRWWLGRECFAKHKCILATRETVKEEDRMDDEFSQQAADEKADDSSESSSSPSRLRSTERSPSGSKAWYNEQAPPFALWVCGQDDLVDGRRLLRRFERGREPHVQVVHSKIIPEYEHLDVIWAMDAPDQIFKEVREVLWKTCELKDMCRTPVGCEAP